jgi:putative NADH-flavin reductase
MGITGMTGRRIASLALARGHGVRALARDPTKVTLEGERLEILAGDARDPQAVDRLVEGTDAVITALGPVRRSFVVARSATANVLRAMSNGGAKTLIVLGGAAMKLPGERAGWRHRLLIALASIVAAPILRDKKQELRLLLASDVDFVYVRPPRLTNRVGKGHPRASAHALPSSSISRDDLALFMLEQAERPTFARQAPYVST